MAETPVALPIVVQAGFAGSRLLYDPTHYPAVDEEKFQCAVQRYLEKRLKQLPLDLGMSPAHFLCGISQIAVGGDFLFTRCCHNQDILQRVFLSERRAEYLSAAASDATPDFSDDEREEAEQLLGLGHIIQECVVSDALEREARFEEVNLEIARVSDVVVCLLREGAASSTGGTTDLLERAEHRGKAGLEIRVSVRHGAPHFEEIWHRRESFVLPGLPLDFALGDDLHVEAGSALPTVHTYCDALRAVAVRQARRLQSRFTYAAMIILLTHVAATLAAVITLKFHAWWTVSLLGGEVLLLMGGLAMHEYLHHSRSARIWAMSRLVAEICRTFSATGAVHTYLDYPFHQPIPEGLRPLLRTLNVLHLRSTRPRVDEPWKPKRDAYVDAHLAGKQGQITYYAEALPGARRVLRRARLGFLTFSLLGVLATLGELYAIWYDHEVGPSTTEVSGLLGILAIILPVFAVATLSLASAWDVEARVHTYEEMLGFLNDQVDQLNSATSEREFVRLMLETESRLLGETANWYSRRSFTGVA